MCCKLEMKTLNNQKITASLQNHGNVVRVPIHAFALHSDILLLFSAKFCTKSEDYFPDRLIL